MKVYEYLEQHGISRVSYYYRLKKVKEAALSQAGLQMPDQLSFDMKTGEILNEAEKLVEHGIPAETDYEEVIVKRKKVKGKRDINLENFDVEIINHESSKEDLENEFPNGWNCLPDYIYKELKYIPAKFKVFEHHVHCDETPFIMPKNGKEYMCVFHSPGDNDTHPIFLYEYLVTFKKNGYIYGNINGKTANWKKVNSKVVM